MTTRLRPRIVEGHGEELLLGCCERELTQMDLADAVAFFRGQGIRGGRAEIEAACAPYGYHPLSLRLLAGLIANDLRQPGDIAAARRLDVSGDLIQHQHHVLEQAYESLTPDRCRLLSRVACFRGPVGYEALAALADDGRGEARPRPKRRGKDRRQKGDREGRPSAWTRISTTSSPAASFTATTEPTASTSTPSSGASRTTGWPAPTALRPTAASATTSPQCRRRTVQTLDDLAPVIELYHHTVRAGQYDEAFTLFRDRIHNAAYYQFGAYQLIIELLTGLFPGGGPLTRSGRTARCRG